jgi:GT2 family glycosyltransferase
VPSLNQGRYLREALESIFVQRLPIEVFVADGGSSDESVDVIQEFAPRLAGWRSHPDRGQGAAINECIAAGRAPFVCWLNSDDLLLPGGLAVLLDMLQNDAAVPAAYGRAWNVNEETKARTPVWVEPFDARRLARRCIVSQPASLIRRLAWESVGGVDETLRFAIDYDLWWRLYRKFGAFGYVPQFIAINRDHAQTKSRKNQFEHYRESIDVVRRNGVRGPLWGKLIPLGLRWRLSRLKHGLVRR